MIKELFEEEYIGTIKLFDESVFDKVFNYLKNTKFGIITASKIVFDRNENCNRNRKLLEDLIAKDIYSIQLVGYWKEHTDVLNKDKDGKDKLHHFEEFFLIPIPTYMNFKEFKEFLMNLAKKYEQTAFIISDGGKIDLYSKDRELIDTLDEITNKNLHKGIEKILSLQLFSQTSKDKTEEFCIENLYITIPKDNISSKMVFKSAKFIYF